MWSKIFDVIYKPLYWLWSDVLGTQLFGIAIRSILFALILSAVVFRLFVMPFVRGRFQVGSDSVHMQRMHKRSVNRSNSNSGYQSLSQGSSRSRIKSHSSQYQLK